MTVVAGFGPQPALGMIVGEAPGFEEVKQGRPFVGKSGKLLDTALKAVGVDRDTVYITNVVKTLPLDDDGKIRRPTPQEIEEWWPILEGEVQNVAPRAILALGRTATNALTGIEDKVPFGSMIGNVFAVWHPSFLLHTGMKQYQIWLDQIRAWSEAIQ